MAEGHRKGSERDEAAANAVAPDMSAAIDAALKKALKKQDSPARLMVATEVPASAARAGATPATQVMATDPTKPAEEPVPMCQLPTTCSVM